MKKINGTKLKAYQKIHELSSQKELVLSIKQHEEEKFRRKVIADFERKLERIKLEMEMNVSLAKYGWIFVKGWSRDCDMCESTRVYKFQSIKAYYKLEKNFYEWLEGPGYLNLISKDEYDSEHKEPTRSRDRILEAYENGNGFSIYV
jgi:hypothetical protein